MYRQRAVRTLHARLRRTAVSPAAFLGLFLYSENSFIRHIVRHLSISSFVFHEACSINPWGPLKQSFSLSQIIHPLHMFYPSNSLSYYNFIPGNPNDIPDQREACTILSLLSYALFVKSVKFFQFIILERSFTQII